MECYFPCRHVRGTSGTDLINEKHRFDSFLVGVIHFPCDFFNSLRFAMWSRTISSLAVIYITIRKKIKFRFQGFYVIFVQGMVLKIALVVVNA